MVGITALHKSQAMDRRTKLRAELDVRAARKQIENERKIAPGWGKPRSIEEESPSPPGNSECGRALKEQKTWLDQTGARVTENKRQPEKEKQGGEAGTGSQQIRDNFEKTATSSTKEKDTRTELQLLPLEGNSLRASKTPHAKEKKGPPNT